MDKKGSHVGVVISFLIFILFLVFLYTILQPSINIGRDKGIILEQIKLNFADESQTEKITIFVIQNNSDIGNVPQSRDCLKITNLNNNLPEGIDFSNLLIKNESDYVLSYVLEGGGNSMRIGPMDSENIEDGVFLKVFYADSVESSPEYSGSGCQNIQDSYELGSLKEEKNQITQSGILNIVSEYENNYGSLKNTLGIPSENDFWFNFTYSNGTSVWPDQRNLPSNIDITSDNDYIIYLDNDANKKIGFIDYLIW